MYLYDHKIIRRSYHRKKKTTQEINEQSTTNRKLQGGKYNSQQQHMQLFPHRLHYCKIQIQLQNILLCTEYTSLNKIFLKFVNYCIIIQYVTHLTMKLLLLMYLTSGINQFLSDVSNRLVVLAIKHNMLS